MIFILEFSLYNQIGVIQIKLSLIKIGYHLYKKKYYRLCDKIINSISNNMIGKSLLEASCPIVTKLFFLSWIDRIIFLIIRSFLLISKIGDYF